MSDKTAMPSAIEKAIASTDWDALATPEMRRQEIRGAFQKIIDSVDNETAGRAVIDTEYVFGNAEAGTYYPSAIQAIPILSMIINHGERFAIWAAVEILHDWLFSFNPEPKYKQISIPDYKPTELKVAVQQRIMEIVPEIMKLRQRSDINEVEISFIKDFESGLD